MGQIQNAFLQGLGAFAQAAQLYKLTDQYAQKNAEKELNKKLEELKKQEESSQVHIKTLAEIRQNGFSEEQEKAFQEKYSKLATTPELAKGEKSRVSKEVNVLKDRGLKEDSPEYLNAIAEQEWLRLNYPSSDDLKTFTAINESSPLPESYLVKLKAKFGEDAFVKKAKKNMKKTAAKGGTV